MYPHRIRLRGPWDLISPDGSISRIDLPQGWPQLVNQHAGSTIQMVRRFGIPRIIDDDENVYLVCCFPGHCACVLNGTSIQPEFISNQSVEWRVTHDLASRNVIQMALSDYPNDAAAPEIGLEIRGPVFLRNIVPTTGGWTGQVLGEQRNNLELHLLAFGRFVSQLVVQANADFALFTPRALPEGQLNPAASPWTIELIEGGNRWYSVDVQTGHGC